MDPGNLRGTGSQDSSFLTYFFTYFLFFSIQYPLINNDRNVMKYLYEFHWEHDGGRNCACIPIKRIYRNINGLITISRYYRFDGTTVPYLRFSPVITIICIFFFFLPFFCALLRTKRFDKTHESTWQIDAWYFVKRGLFFNDYSIFFFQPSQVDTLLYLFPSVTIIFVSQTEIRKKGKSNKW